MKSLLLSLALLCSVVLLSQNVSRVIFYSHLDFLGSEGKFGRKNKVTDGFSESGTGINVGFLVRYNKKWGLSAEFSDWFFRTDIDQAIPLLRDRYSEIYNLENRSISSSGSAFIDHWQFSVIKVGAFYSFMSPQGRMHLDVKMGYMLPIKREGAFLVENQSRLIQSDSRQLLYTVETQDGLTAYTYTEVGNGMLGELSFQYFLKIPNADWFNPFVGLGLQIGSFEYRKIDFTEDPLNPELNQSINKSNRMGFVNPKVQIGVSINFLPLE